MLNPREYDLDELRDVAGVDVRVDGGEASEARRSSSGEGSEFDGGEAEPTDFGRPLPAADLVTLARQYRELAARGDEPDGDALPLAGVPDDAGSVMLTLEWLDFLVYRAGVHGALGALDYYRDVGWLTGRAERQLRSYLRGLDAPGGRAGGLDALDARDHRQSLLFVTRLASGGGLPRPDQGPGPRETDGRGRTRGTNANDRLPVGDVERT